MAAGIETRHARSCRSLDGGRCNCRPTYRSSVWSARDGKRIRKTFSTLSGAKAWRQDAHVALREGTMSTPSPVTVREVGEAWLEGARDGSVRDRSGRVYKPATIRGYERGLKLRVLPALGHLKLSEVRRSDVQAIVDSMLGEGKAPRTIQNTIDPLRSIYRRAMRREQVVVNPTVQLEVPAARGRRDRIASPEEGRRLITALPAEQRALWATAMYAGLRRGELRGLRWSDVDLGANILRVERAWDDHEGPIEGKTEAAKRTVPIGSDLRRMLLEHKLRTGRDGDALVFGVSAVSAFDPSTSRRRALAAWKVSKLDPIGFHECRHTFASLMIAAGVNAKALSSYMGHASITITLDRYGHLFPGNEAEAAGLLDAYLSRSAGQSVGQ
jgi:integrase